MSIIVTFNTLGLVSKEKQVVLPDHAYGIHTDFGGWNSDRDIYLWWKEFGVDKCKKIVSTKWKVALNEVKINITPCH